MYIFRKQHFAKFEGDTTIMNRFITPTGFFLTFLLLMTLFEQCGCLFGYVSVGVGLA